MSTSRYSKADVTSPSRTDDYPEVRLQLNFDPPRNRRRWTAVKLVTITALLAIDLLALIGTNNMIEVLGLVILVVVNLWALNCR